MPSFLAGPSLSQRAFVDVGFQVWELFLGVDGLAVLDDGLGTFRGFRVYSGFQSLQ